MVVFLLIVLDSTSLKEMYNRFSLLIPDVWQVAENGKMSVGSDINI